MIYNIGGVGYFGDLFDILRKQIKYLIKEDNFASLKYFCIVSAMFPSVGFVL